MKKWSTEETEQLKELYKTHSRAEIAIILNTSIKSVINKIDLLKLTKIPQVYKNYSSISKEILSYTARIIDGEGHIGIHKTKIKSRNSKTYFNFSVNLSVFNKDKRLINFLYDTYTGSKYLGKRQNGKKYYRWSLATRNVCNLLRLVYPYLVFKKEQEGIKETREHLFNKLKLLHHLEFDDDKEFYN